jgi:hypothetical protein
MATTDDTQLRPNRLAREKSPYLQQHAYNPVDWYPWGDEAFERARREERPIFLSIGYSTCHWCHVMERESFESEELAAILNEHYVAIKVDREERPDVDRVYMAAVQALTGSGGWPLSAWLTPDLEPFYAGTYFPPQTRGGLPGFGDLLVELARAFGDQREKVVESATSIVEALRQVSVDPGGDVLEAAAALERGFRQYERIYDSRCGGFGGAPKFPRPSVLPFLLRYGQQHAEPAAIRMAVDTLRQMWAGGLNDHLGGGFHRYSVDAYWRVPHFEKMLYDQAQLVWAYLEAFQVTAESFFAEVARQILSYVEECLTSPEGGFYSAQDADSAIDSARPEEKLEGAFYLWGKDEIERLLDGEEAAVLCHRYGVSEGGNTLHDPHGELGTGNVLYAAHDTGDTARELGLEEERVRELLDRGRRKLMEARGRRPRPHLDDKILTSWNGLMISAFARAAQVLGEPGHAATARRAADFVLAHNRTAGALRRRHRDGETAHPAQLDDYAFLALGLLDLYEATAESTLLEEAEGLVDEMVERFADDEGPGFFDNDGEDPSILIRTKDGYDGAEPAGNSVAALVLLRLGRMLNRGELEARARSTMEAFSKRLTTEPHTLPQMLVALAESEVPARQIVLAGDPSSPAMLPLQRVIQQHLIPGRILLYADGAAGQELLARGVEAIGGMTSIDGEPRAYVCRRFHCEQPTADPALLEKLLQSPDR